MRLTTDIDKFIENNNLKPVTSSRPYGSGGKLDPNGLFSEDIFGRMGSKERRKKFGYIPLHCHIIHPEIWEVLASVDVAFSKLLTNKKSYLVDDNGMLFEDDVHGKSGVFYFSKIFKQINWDNYSKKKPKACNYIKEHIDTIFIDKEIVIPAGIRDIQILKETNTTRIQFAEINRLYETVLRQSNTIVGGNIDMLPEDISSAIVHSIQRTVLDINFWISSRLKGKQGVIRGGLLRKSTDYSGRCVVAGDPSIRLGYIGVPWQIVLKLFEPFAIHNFFKKDHVVLSDIKDVLNLKENPDINEIKRFISKINEDYSICNPALRDKLKNIATEIVKDKVVLYKRDQLGPLNKELLF